MSESSDVPSDWLQLLLANLKEYAIFFIDENAIIRTWHPAVEGLLGYPRDEFIGLPAAALFPPENREESAAAEIRAAQETGRANDDRWHVKRDGTPIYVFGALIALRDASGQLVGFAKVMRDRTDQLKLIQQLRQARQVAETASRDKDAFVAMVAHEVRQPLNVIEGWLRMVETAERRDELFARAMPAVRRSTETMQRLVSDLLDVSRLALGRLEIERRSLDAAALVQQCVEGIRQAAAGRGIETLCTYVDGARVNGDPIRLSQVVNNLLTNALKFTPDNGWIRIDVDPCDEQVRIAVTDSGAGIDPRHLPELFTRFSQLDRRRDQYGFSGFGLGLWLVRELVAAHGGTVHAESDGQGKGSSFVILLPCG